MLTVAELLALWVERERVAGPNKSRDRETLEYFEGRVSFPTPEIAGMSRDDRSMVANLLAQGVTAKAQRIASTRPAVTFSVGRARSKAADTRARKKKQALIGMWDENRLHLQDRQRARWLIAYASSPVSLRPSFRKGKWQVRWELRSPLGTYPAPTPAHIDMEPVDVVYASTAGVAGLCRDWPDAAGVLRAFARDVNGNPAGTVTLIEFDGPDEYVYAAVGNRDPYDTNSVTGLGSVATHGGKWIVELARAKNPVGRCCSVVPNSIALENPLSEFEGMKGLYQAQAKLMALEYRAVANSVDPPVWFVENDTGGEIVTVADGPAGIVGHIRGGDLKPLNVQPGFQTYPTIDRLERAQRLESGVPADFGGENATGTRTARRGSELLASVVDFPIQEAQEMLAQSRKLEDDIAIETQLESFPDQPSVYGGFEFTPRDVFTKNDWHEVSYALAGADANGQVIRVGQLQGTGLMSKQTARTLIPDIRDPEFEDDQVIYEQIQQGLLAEFMQPDPTGQFSLIFKNRVAELVRDNKKDLVDAIAQVQREAQEQQSTTVDPVAPGSPEAMPGIGGPAAAAGTAPEPASDLQGLSSLLTQLRGPQVFETQGERVAEAGASV